MALVELARERAGLDFQEGRSLLAARRASAHRELGYGSFTEYIQRLFGYAPRVTHDKLRVAEALEGLPELARELREGGLSFSHVRELTRVATPDAALLLLARHVLGGPTDDGRASYQAALDVCEDCGRARQIADGEAIDVSSAVAEMACCDAQWLPRAHVGDPGQNSQSGVEPLAVLSISLRKFLQRRFRSRGLQLRAAVAVQEPPSRSPAAAPHLSLPLVFPPSRLPAISDRRRELRLRHHADAHALAVAGSFRGWRCALDTEAQSARSAIDESSKPAAPESISKRSD